MKATADELWTEAYKSSHVCADICEKIVQGRTPDTDRVSWLREEAANLLDLARELKRQRQRDVASNKTRPLSTINH